MPTSVGKRCSGHIKDYFACGRVPVHLKRAIEAILQERLLTGPLHPLKETSVAICLVVNVCLSGGGHPVQLVAAQEEKRAVNIHPIY